MPQKKRRDRRKTQQTFNVRVNRKQHNHLYDLFCDLAESDELSDYIRDGVYLLTVVKNRDWETLLKAYPEFYQFLNEHAPQPQIIVQGGGIQPALTAQPKLGNKKQVIEDNDAAFERLLSDDLGI